MILFHNGRLKKSVDEVFIEQSDSKVRINLYGNQDLNPIFLMNSWDSIEIDPLEFEIVAKKDSNYTLIEHHSFSSQACNNYKIQKVQVHLENKSRLQHILLREGMTAKTERKIIQDEESIYNGTDLSLADHNQENKLSFDLLGKNAFSEYYILLFPKENYHSNVDLVFNHKDRDCRSKVVARSYIPSKAVGNFKGKIIIQKEGNGAFTHLENKSLTSGTGAITTHPEFEIYTDDLEGCTHGATVGHFDDQALFYLESRGIDKKEARFLLINAFLEPIFSRIQNYMHLGPIHLFIKSLDRALHEN